MIQIVINYSPAEQSYKIYEPTTQNLILSTVLSEGLVLLSKFLQEQGMIEGDILTTTEEISYHLDSASLGAMIKSNVDLLKRLKSAPSGFQTASQRFGGSLSGSAKKDPGEGNYKADGKKKYRGSGGFSGATGFQSAYKKFGNKR